MRSRREMKRAGDRERERGEGADAQDDKVGAALSMTYVTGQPILFVGCGQTYTDLRHLRVNHIVQALLS
jgi:signal recognition particle GTPase